MQWAIVLTVVLLLVYLPSLFIPHLSPAVWWPMVLLSIGYPLSWVAVVVAAIAWFFYKWRWGLALLLCAAAGWPLASQSLLLRPPATWQVKKAAGSLRIMQWNCAGLAGVDPSFPKQLALRNGAVNFIKEQQPDIILLADFTDLYQSTLASNVALLADSLGYQHHYFPYHFQIKRHWGTERVGTAIFSKLPLSDTTFFAFAGRPYPERVAEATVYWQGKPLRVAAAHLQSMNLNTAKGSPPMVDYHQWIDSNIITSGSVFKKLAYYSPYHTRQAAALSARMANQNVPIVLGVDANSTPTSFSSLVLKRGMSDAFTDNGSGLGHTFDLGLPLLRIDYLLGSQQRIKWLQCQRFVRPYSDHFPLIADLRWP